MLENVTLVFFLNVLVFIVLLIFFFINLLTIYVNAVAFLSLARKVVPLVYQNHTDTWLEEIFEK